MKYVAEVLSSVWFLDETSSICSFGPGEDYSLHSVVSIPGGRQIAIWKHHGEFERLRAELSKADLSEHEAQRTKCVLQDQRRRALNELSDVVRLCKNQEALLRAKDITATTFASNLATSIVWAIERALRVLNERTEGSVAD